MRKHTLFISDLHLEDSHTHITTLFLRFLTEKASHCDALYILGDLFETFIGDDENTPLHQKVTQGLSQLSAAGVPIYLMHGNRDFLLGKAFAKRCQATLIPDPTVIDLYGKRTLLMHGDTLCTQDVKYLAFRKKARNVFLQKLFLARSLKKRQAIAAKARELSRIHTQQTNTAILDVTPSEVPRIMQQHDAQHLIHGHTHRPGFHYLRQQDRFLFRAILGDWEKTGYFLACDIDGAWRLESVRACSKSR